MQEKTKPVGSHIVLLQISTLCCQCKEQKHKQGQMQVHDTHIIHIYAKGTSREKAMSSGEEIKPVALSIWLKASLS